MQRMNLSIFLILLLIHSGFSTSSHRYRNTLVKRAKSCQFNMCEEDYYYPHENITQIIKAHPKIHSFFKGDVLKTEKDGLAMLSRDGENLVSFCKVKQVTMSPKMMYDSTNKKMLHIVNVENFRQTISYELCTQAETEGCFAGTLLGLRTKCVQKFHYVKLVTVDIKSRQVPYRTFRVPTTCVCTYTKDFNF